MNVQEIRELYSAAPFQPFEIVLTNGTTVYVGHPEFLMFTVDKKTIHVADERDGANKRIDVKLITALNELTNGAAGRKPRRRK